MGELGQSEAVFVGQWNDQAVATLHGGLNWGKGGLKVLGVFLGFQSKNWEGVKENVCA